MPGLGSRICFSVLSMYILRFRRARQLYVSMGCRPGVTVEGTCHEPAFAFPPWPRQVLDKVLATDALITRPWDPRHAVQVENDRQPAVRQLKEHAA
jgi:hypothetical protein